MEPPAEIGVNYHLPYDAPQAPLVAPPELGRYETVTIDFEGDGVDWARGSRPCGLAVAYGDQRVYLPFAHRGGGNLDEGQVKRFAQRELRGKRILGAHLRADLHFSRVWGVDLRQQDNTFRDVAHMAALLDDHRTTFALDALAQDELGTGKLNIGRPEHIWELPGNTVAPYACVDVQLPTELHAAYWPRIVAEGLERVLALEDQIIPVVVELEANGLPLNLEKLTRWTGLLARIAERLTLDLQEAAGFACNPDKKDHMARLFTRAGIFYGRTPTGQPAFPGVEVAAAAERDAAIKLAYRLGKVRDLISKVIAPFGRNHVNGVLYPSYHQLRTDEGGTISGRFSSSKPNGQNLPNKDRYERSYGWLREYSDEVFLTRDLVVPERGRWFCADQQQVEYRVAGHYTQDERIIRQYKDDPKTDFHNFVQELIRPLRRDITRTETKTVGFCRLYGGGIQKIADMLEVEYNEAEVLVGQYDGAFPAFGALARRAESVANQRGYVKTILGRRCRFPGQPGRRDRTYKSLNAIVQGSAADLNKLALVAVYEQKDALGFTMRNTEHDSLGGDLEGAAEPLLALLNEQRLPLRIPVLWAGGLGDSWASAKS